MTCPRCGEDNSPAAKFCGGCGQPVARVCPGCGHTNPPGNRFCSGCGSRLAAGPAPWTAADTPKHLAEKILTYRAALEGERKQVTVLFADLKGSLELLADRDPEEARQVLDPVLRLLMDAVHHFEGTVNQVLGDGIMALFGAPLAHEDHAVRACYAALRMHEAIERYARDLRATRGVDVQIRVGLNSGEVVVRSIGSDLHMDYTAVGQTTHLAARMEQLARPGTVLLTAATARLAEGWVSLRALGPVPVKGLGQAVEVFELIGPGPIRSRLGAAASRGLSRFVGREAEVAQLGQALERAEVAGGQVVAVIGEPGVGKSRLVWEFRRSPRLERWRVLEAGAVGYGRATAYLPVVGLLRSHFELGEGEDPRAARERVVGALGPEELGRFLAPLLALLEVPVEDPGWAGLDPNQRRERTLEAVTHVLLRRSQAEPLCVVVEDLHWVDHETQAVLDRLVERLPLARLLLLVTYRPEYEHGWTNKSHYTRIRLEPLPAAAAQTLLEALLGPAAELGPVRALLIERTEGNPFFIEESVRNLAETGVLVGAPGAYRLARPPDEAQVPQSVQAVLAARIDRLTAEDKWVLQAASAIGREVPLALLGAAAELAEAALRPSVSRLLAGEFLHESRLFPEIVYGFTHALVQEVAYGGLVRDRRRALDARIVEALERRGAERGDEDADRLAHHAVRGELWDRALLHCRAAGARAFTRSAHRAAVSHFQNALGALAHLPERRETLEAAVDLRLELRYALSPLGEYRQMLEHLTEAERRAGALGDQRRLGRVSSFLCNFFTIRGDFARAIEYGQRARDIARALGDPSLEAPACSMLTAAHYATGEYREAIALARGNIEGLQGRLAVERFGMLHPPSVYSRTMLAWSLAELGEFAEARAAGEEGVALAEHAGLPQSVIFACLGLGTVHLRQGALEGALAVLERGRALWEKVELPPLLLELAGPLGSAYAQAGRAGEAIALLERAVARAVALRHPLGHWLRTGGMAEAYLAAGRAEEALPLAALFVEITGTVNARGARAWALRLLGEVAEGQQPPDAERAEKAYTEALAAAGDLGMRPLEARCRLALGLLCGRAGAPDRAAAELAAAGALLRRLGMTRWLTIAERAALGPEA